MAAAALSEDSWASLAITGNSSRGTALTQLLKREAFRWTPAAAAAFDALKLALTTAPVLQLPYFDRLFMVNCDVSGTGFGAVLHQGGRPMAFFHRVMSP
jgi:hypothetical protein